MTHFYKTTYKVCALVLILLFFLLSGIFAQGDIIWKKNFGGIDGNEYYAVAAVSDGIVAVGISSNASFGTKDWSGVTGKDSIDAIIVKYDHNGNVMWKKNFGGNGIDNYTAVATVSDGVAAVGYSNNGSFGNGDWNGVTGKGGRDAIMVKYLDEEVTNAQISNIHADFSCPEHVTITYDLNTNQPVDLILYYSHNKCDWMIAQTVSGDLTAQSTGTGKTINWNNSADNVKYGKFYFKVAE